MMDKKIRRTNKKILKYSFFTVAISALVIFTVSMTQTERSLTLDKSILSIKKVQLGEFEDVILFSGTVEPMHTVLVNSLESGAIREIFVEDGDLITKGQKLVELYNPTSEFNYLTQETSIIEQINNLRNTRISIKSEQLNLAKQLAAIDHEYNKSKRSFQVDSSLYVSQAIAQIAYEESKEIYRYQKLQKSIIKQSIESENRDRLVQLNRLDESIGQMEKSLQKLKSNKENFIVRAFASGKLSSFNPVIGMTFSSGESVGKIDLMDGYIVEAQVNEFYINQIQIGQEAHIQMGDSIYKLHVAKIMPEVNAGKFDVYLHFKEGFPPDMKRGMTFSIKAFLTNKLQKSILLAKGGFYQSSAGKYVYVLTSQNNAKKRTIKIGRSNPYYYEILEGLEVDDQVICSSYENFKHINSIKLK